MWFAQLARVDLLGCPQEQILGRKGEMHKYDRLQEDNECEGFHCLKVGARDLLAQILYIDWVPN